MQSFTIDSCALSLEVLYKARVSSRRQECPARDVSEAMVYIEDGMAENDGSFAAVDVMVPSNGPALGSGALCPHLCLLYLSSVRRRRGTTNAFSAYPKLVSIAGAVAWPLGPSGPPAP